MGTLDWTYINAIKSIVHWADLDHIYVSVDMHQWKTSSYCINQGDGFPGWFVKQLLNDSSCTNGSQEDQFLTNFWNNAQANNVEYHNYTTGITWINAHPWDAFMNIWEVIANQLKDYNNIAGWDVLNEPEYKPNAMKTALSNFWDGVNLVPEQINFLTAILPAFYLDVSFAIRKYDSTTANDLHHILFYEGEYGRSNFFGITLNYLPHIVFLRLLSLIISYVPILAT